MTENLPAALSVGLDLDELDAATRGLDIRLGELLGEHVKARREERRQTIGDAPPTVGDVAGVIRELASAADVFERIAGDFRKGASAAREFIADEALETGADRLSIPDGGTQINVAPDVKTTTTFEPDGLGAVLCFQAADAYDPFETPSADGADAEEQCRDHFRQGFLAGWGAVQEYGRVEWRVTSWKALATRLLDAAEDALASAVERSFVTKREDGGRIKVTRGELKPGRRR